MGNLPSSNQSNPLPLWFLLLLGLGGPLATGITIAQTRQSIWQAVGTGILFMIIFLAFSIVAGVWQQLADNWVKRIADWINSSHNYQKYYCQWFVEQHNQLDIGGLRIYETPLAQLEHIFVELKFAQKPPYQISSAAFNVPEASYAPRHPISYYIDSTQNHLVILGRPGTGKTITLRNLGVSLINRNKQRRIPKSRYMQTFLLSLRDYGTVIKEQDQFSLVDAIQTSLSKWNRAAPPGWIEGWLKKGHCLILLDGLDEIPDAEARQAIARWVEQHMVTYGQKNRFILTSRPQGYIDNPINGKVAVLEVQGFSYTQIEEFVDKWYRAEENIDRPKHAPGTFEHARHKADRFLQRLRGTPTLLDLARNPLMLTMSIIVDGHRGVLPGSRGELYKEIFEVFLGGRQRAKGLRVAPSQEQNQLVLQHLAFYMMEKGTEELTPAVAQSVIEEPLKSVNTQLTPQTFLKIIEDSNIWVRQGADIYGFAHLSFQEYLAAIHVKEKNLFRVLVEHIAVNWWHETIVLYCNRADASPIIKECLTRRPLSVSALRLALECEEAASRSSFIADLSVRVQFNNVLIQGTEDTNPEIRHMVAEAWLTQRMKKMLLLSDAVYVTTSLIACAEYQLFLDEHQEEAYHQPDHWKDKRFPPGQGRISVIGVRPSDALAFCAWLTNRDPENWLYRLPRRNEQEKIEELRTEEENLIVGIGYWVDEGRGPAWAKKEPSLSNDILRKRLDSIWAEDEKQVQDVKALEVLRTSDDRRLQLAKHLIIARNIIYTRILHHNLRNFLTSIYDRIRHHEGVLKTDYENTHNEINGLRALLAKKSKEKADFQRHLEKRRRLETNLTSANSRAASLQTQLVHIGQDAQTLLDQLAKAEKQVKGEQRQLTRTFGKQHRSQLQSQIADINMQKNSMEAHIRRKQEEKQYLIIQSNEARVLVTQLQGQLNTINENELNRQLDETSRQEDELNRQIDEASRQENMQKKRLEQFRTQARPFYNICKRFLTFTPTYNGDARFNALARNHVLDFDRILVDVNNSMEILGYIDILVSTYLRELTESLNEYHRDIDININGHNIKSDIALALNLADQLKQITFGDNVQRLGDILKSYFNYLDQNRPFGREVRSYIRLYIRYFAGVLAQHLLYWSWRELASSAEQSSHLQQMIDQRIVDTYFDVNTAFVLLEERIMGNLAAKEGILIVREHRGENEEVDERIV